jgi:outer membrane protein TolC
VLLALPAFAAPKASRPAAPTSTSPEPSEAWLDAAVGKPNGLTANDAAARAVESSLVVEQRSEDVNAASALVGQATVGWFPRLLGTARYARLSYVEPQSIGTLVVAPMAPAGPLGPGAVLVNAPATIASLQNATLFQATLLIPVSDYFLKIPQTHFAASAAREAASLQLQATRLGVALEGRLFYYGWARAHLTALVAEQAVVNAKAHRTLADRVFEAGGASKADVLRVDAAIASAELFSARIRTQETVLAEQLRTVMHQKDSAAFEIGEALNTPLPAKDLPSTAELMSKAKDVRLEVKALEQTFKAFDSQAMAARAGYLPKLDAFADVVYANPNQRYFPPKDSFEATWDVGAQLSWSPNEVAFASQATDGVLARRRQAELQKEQFFDALRIEVTQATAAVTEADLTVESTRRGLAAAEESYRVRKELFQNERSTSTELTDAETDLTQARLNAVAARIDQRVAHARLDHAIGADMETPAK